MKTLISVLFGICLSCQAATWTFHNFKDNAPTIRFVYYDPSVQNVQTRYIYWDWGYDVANPDAADSGYYHVVFGVIQPDSILGYHDDYTIQVEDWMPLITATLYGNYPDYCGGLDFRSSLAVPGEYWIDFAQDGSSRISTSLPSEFGKWSCGGTLNPDWTAAKKGLAKGHNKQPLPSPK